MATRLATLAMVPVKRVWIAVNPVSKGEPLCARAAEEAMRKKVSRVAVERIPLVQRTGAICKEN
jgi:hypothetical protein